MQELRNVAGLSLLSFTLFMAAAVANPQEQRSAAEIFEQVAPGVVIIEVPGETIPESAPGEIKELMDAIGRTFGSNPSLPNLASGFIVDGTGTVLTAHHAVSGREQINVKLKDGRTFPAKVVGLDEHRDLCLLHIDAEDLPALELGDSSTLKPGQRVIAIGAPQGLAYSVSEGVVASVRSDAGLLQFTAPVSPGNSGGPVFDQTGRVIGVIKRSEANGQNLNFAVLIDEAKPLIASRPTKAPASGAGVAQDAHQLAREAEQAFLKGNSTRAFELWQQAVALAPDAADIHLSLGLAYVYSSRNEDGRREIAKALSINPDVPGGNTALCAAYSRMGLYNHAISACERAIGQNPNDAAAYRELGTIYQQTAEFNKTSDTGDASKAAAEFNQASEYLRKAVALDPNDPVAHSILGLVFLGQGDLSQASAEVEKALFLNPNTAHAHYAAALVAFQKGEYDRALQRHDQAVSLGAQFDPEFSQKLMRYRKGR
jgi:S1-C subfamily serine protease